MYVLHRPSAIGFHFGEKGTLKLISMLVSIYQVYSVYFISNKMFRYHSMNNLNAHVILQADAVAQYLYFCQALQKPTSIKMSFHRKIAYIFHLYVNIWVFCMQMESIKWLECRKVAYFVFYPIITKYFVKMF